MICYSAPGAEGLYDAYARLLVNRRMVVPENTVAGVVEFAREQVGRRRGSGLAGLLPKSKFLVQ